MAKKKQNILFSVGLDGNISNYNDNTSNVGIGKSIMFSVGSDGKVTDFSVPTTVKSTSNKKTTETQALPLTKGENTSKKMLTATDKPESKISTTESSKKTTKKKKISKERQEELQKGYLEQRMDENIWGAKKLGSGIFRWGTNVVDSGLQDVQSNFEEGAKRKEEDYLFKVPAEYALKRIAAPVVNPIKNFQKDQERKKQGMGLGDRMLAGLGDSAKSFIEMTSPGMLELNELMKAHGTYDKNAAQKVAELSKDINKPSQDFQKSLNEESKRYGDVTKFLGNAVETVGYMAPSIATTALTKDPNVGLAAMGIGAKGGATREAINKGKDLDTAIGIGTAKAAIEVLTEKLTGGIKFGGKSVYGEGVLDNVAKSFVDKVAKKPLVNFLTKEGIAIGGEVVEEILADVADVLIDYTSDTPDNEKSLGGLWDKYVEYFKKDFGNTVAQTIASTLIMNLIGGSYTPKAYQENIQNMNESAKANDINHKYEAYKEKVAQNQENKTSNENTQINNQLNEITNENTRKSEIVNEVIEDANLSTELDNLTADEISERINRQEISEPIKTRAEIAKQKQLDIINQFNPAREGSQQTWIRSVDDIKTLKEAAKSEDLQSYTPDFTEQDLQKALKKGEITVYSSHPIEQGAFITPSQMEAQSYAGNGKVYSKTIPIDDVAWIDTLQGQYAKIPNEIKTYNQNQDIQTEKSKILTEMPKDKTTFAQKVDKKIKDARYNLVDHLAPFYDLSRETGNMKLYWKADRTQSSDALAQRMITDNQVNMRGKVYKNFTDMDGNKVAMSWEKAYDLYKDIPKEAKNSYIVNMRNIDNLKQGLNQFDISYEDSVNTINQLTKQYGDINKWAENIWTYQDNLLQNMVDEGTVSQEQADIWRKENPHYVRIQRNIDRSSSALQNRGRNVKVNNQIQKVKGSTLEILPIKETVAKYTQGVVKGIRMNDAIKEYAKTVGVDSNGQQVTNLDEIFGVNDEVLQKTKDGYTATFYENGQQITIPISEDIYKALQPRNIKKAPLLSQTVKVEKNLLTGRNPYFATRNAVRDAFDMILYSKFPLHKSVSTYIKLFTGRTAGRGINGANNLLNGTNNATKTMQWVELYENTGNEASSYFHDGKFKGNVARATDKYEPIGNINDFIESMPRITEFVNTIESEGYTLNNDGELVPMEGKTPKMSVEDVLAEASYNAADVTVNFKRGGTWARNVDANGGLFFNPAVQGTSKFVRNITEAIGDARNGDYTAIKRGITRAIGLGVVPAVVGAFMYGGDKDYEDLPDYIKQQYYLIKIKGTDKFIRIPKGRAASILENAAKRTGDTIKGKKDAWDGFDELVMNQMAPNNPLDNNVLSPWVAARDNKSWSGNQIVSDYLNENFEPQDQYDAKTSEISKWISKQVKDVPLEKVPLVGAYLESIKSPKKLDYIIDQYSGVIGDVALPSTTNYAESEDNSGVKALTNPLKSQFVVDSTLNNKSVSEYNKIKKNIKKKSQTGTNKEKAINHYLNGIGNYKSDIEMEMSNLYAKQREIQNNNKLSDAEKYKKNKEIQKEINELAKKTVKNVENATEKNGIVTIGTRVYYPTKNEETGKEEMKTISGDKVRTVTRTGLSAEEYAKIYSAISKIETDKDKNGKSISGSKKKKTISYLNSYGLSDNQIKAIVEAQGWKYK